MSEQDAVLPPAGERPQRAPAFVAGAGRHAARRTACQRQEETAACARRAAWSLEVTVPRPRSSSRPGLDRSRAAGRSGVPVRSLLRNRGRLFGQLAPSPPFSKRGRLEVQLLEGAWRDTCLTGARPVAPTWGVKGRPTLPLFRTPRARTRPVTEASSCCQGKEGGAKAPPNISQPLPSIPTGLRSLKLLPPAKGAPDPQSSAQSYRAGPSSTSSR